MVTQNNWVGPSVPPASGCPPQSLVILLHGYSSKGDDIIALASYWREYLPDTLFIAPNAPQSFAGSVGGRQWWPLTSFSPEALASGVRMSAPALDAVIDEQVDRLRLTDDKVALVGFSQGAMVALHVGPRRERRLAGIVGYSGMLGDPAALRSEVKTTPPILIVHGDDDTTIPVNKLDDAHLALSSLGFAVTTHISKGAGHGTDEASLKLGGEFLARVLS